MSDRIIKDVNIKCDKCDKDNKYIKSRLDDLCGCNGAYKQYSTEYENMDNEK